MIEIPTDDYEYGETLHFKTVGWSYYSGTFIRQIGDNITIKVTKVRWGIEDCIGTEETFNIKYLTDEINIDNLFTVYFPEVSRQEYDYYPELEYEELFDEDDNDVYIPTTIGTTNTIVKGINHIGKRDSKPRDGPMLTNRYNT